MTPIYFDNAATTPLHTEVAERITKVLSTNYGNPSSTHSFGRSSKVIVEQARKTIAKQFGVTASEIYFTSGGTEANNLVLRSAVRDLGVKTIISSQIEHHAVLHTLFQLQEEYNIEVKYVNIDDKGGIDFDHLESLISSNNKALVSLMHVNNEIGNVLNISKVSELCKQYNALFHTDAVQSVGHFNIDLASTPIDFLSASAHKFHGPKGVGFCFIRKQLGLKPLIFGGEQERGLRAGTESVHNIAGLETALSISYKNLEAEKTAISNLKTYFISELNKHFPNIVFNGNSDLETLSSYTIVNVSIPVKNPKQVLFQLDLKGIACSQGSACQSGSSKGSHVLEALRSTSDTEKASLRFSFSKYNTADEVDTVINVLKTLAV